MSDDGWGEPHLGVLRTVAALVVTILLAWLVIADSPRDTTVIATLMGGLLVLLGYEAGLRLPGGKP